MEPRVTLSDFHRLQAQLLEVRQQLIDSQERETAATAALERHRVQAAASSAAAAAAHHATATSYPEELNPFGNPFGGGGSSCASAAAAGRPANGGTADAGPSSGASSPADVRAAIVRERCLGAQRTSAVQQRWLMRLTFHAWRASHSQTCILRNMTSMVQARTQAAADAPPQHPILPAALTRLIGEREQGASARSAAEVDSTQLDALAAEVRLLEAELARVAAARDKLQARCHAGNRALQELCTTSAAMYGRALYAVEEQEA